MESARQQRKVDDEVAINQLVAAVDNDDFDEIEEDTEQVIEYVAGYLAHSAFKIHKCEHCRYLLMNCEAYPRSYRWHPRSYRRHPRSYRRHLRSYRRNLRSYRRHIRNYRIHLWKTWM